jgi:hypothetical protein
VREQISFSLAPLTISMGVGEGIERHRQTLLLISMSAQTAYVGKPCTKTAAAPREHTLKAARPAIPPTSIIHEHLPRNLVNPKQQSQRLHE